jgi:FixJ family two-component response regulator
MEPRHRVHIVDVDGRRRAELARMVFDIGHHAKVYAGWDELVRRPPELGIVLACDVPDGNEAFAALGRAGIWLPLILAAESPATERVVEGIKRGALDFLDLPCAAERLASALSQCAREAEAQGLSRKRMLAARERIATLSRREHEVLEWLSDGCSNKAIARTLGISPRTVEIHRANMMAKLGAHHAAHAVRMWIEVRFDDERPLRKSM